jgi:hypothetical protein
MMTVNTVIATATIAHPLDTTTTTNTSLVVVVGILCGGS